MIDQHAIAIAGVAEVAAIAAIVLRQAGRLRLGGITADIDVLEQREAAVGAVHLVAARAETDTDRLVTIAPTVLRRPTSRRTRSDCEIRLRHSDARLVFRLDVQRADCPLVDLAGEPAATDDRHRAGPCQTDPAAVEQ